MKKFFARLLLLIVLLLFLWVLCIGLVMDFIEYQLGDPDKRPASYVPYESVRYYWSWTRKLWT